MSQTMRVLIWRGAADGAYVEYEVPRLESQTVLDVVTYVQRQLDPSLAYRFACRVGVCGSCAMTVNGMPRWTCRTHVSKVAHHNKLTLGPLRNLPVIKDLAADMTRFFDKWQQAKGVFAPSATRNDKVAAMRPDSEARIAIDKAIECINCGVCYSACDMVAWDADYLGPAALNRAWTLVNDPRDADNKKRLMTVTGTGGCQNCHTHTSCERLCPKKISPTDSIAGLKRRAVSAYVKGELR
jgi:succinate dehydrogenase iron-sulfur subunit